MKRIYVLCICFIAITFFILGCANKQNVGSPKSSSSENQNAKHDFTVSEDLDQVISEYIILKANGCFYPTQKQFEVHEILGTDETSTTLAVYMISLYEGYSFKDGYFERLAGAVGPRIIKLEKANGKYKAIDLWEPMDGTHYTSSIKKSFPPKLVKRALENNSANLHTRMNTKALNWLKSEGKSEKIKTY